MTRITVTLELSHANVIMKALEAYERASHNDDGYTECCINGALEALQETTVESEYGSLPYGVYNRTIENEALWEAISKHYDGEFGLKEFYPDGSVLARNLDTGLEARFYDDGRPASEPFDWARYGEDKALAEIDDRLRDMRRNPDCYFEADDPRRQW